MSVSLSRERAHDLAQNYTLLPLCLRVMADLETPVTAYTKVARGLYSFLLESVEGGERLARYSFLGTEPRCVLRFSHGRGERLDADGRLLETIDADPLSTLQREVLDVSTYIDPALPPLVGGAVGYMGYEMVRLWEPHVPPTPGAAAAIPDGVLLLTDTVLAFDHIAHHIHVITHLRLDGTCEVDEEYDRAIRRVEALAARLREPLSLPEPIRGPLPDGAVTSNMTQSEHAESVEAIRDLIRGGDAIQIVLSQRFQRPINATPFTVYRALRTVAPTPYMYFLHLDDVDVAGASVETLVRVTSGDIYYHPIAGTRPRGRTPDEDRALEAELRVDEKELAEHIMLVDLGRNDVGRVAAVGSVRVTELMSVERYSHVMHLVSTIEGHLEEGLTALDAFRSCFPAGTVSGAPKVRAMEILAEMEKGSRGLYAGAVGYVTYGGDLDTCIAFRTAVMKDGVAYIQAGGGIVADSVPAHEYAETVHKAAAVQRAISLAETGFEVSTLPDRVQERSSS